jgi:hypothetical protein
MAALTKTKRARIAKEIRQALAGERLDGHAIRTIASRNHVQDMVVQNIAQSDFNVKIQVEVQPVVVTPAQAKKAAPLSDLVKASLIRGIVSKKLRHDDDDDNLVITTLGQWKRERMAFRRWLQELGVDLSIYDKK